MEIKNVFKGLTLGERQQVGVMSVIPLLSEEDATQKLANFEDVTFKRTNGYGTMVFGNTSEYPFILPTGYSIITEQAAQDHGNTFAQVIDPNGETYLANTCCIQSTQGGYISGDEKMDFSLLPLYIKKAHFKNYLNVKNNKLEFKEYSFSRLWDIISEFQKKMIKEDKAHLVYFFTKFVDQLNRFNAEFEVVPNQRGAIILINDKIVGVEVAPTFSYWKTIWKKIIRDCYGSEIVRLSFENLVEEFQGYSKPELSKAQTIAEIRALIADHASEKNQNILEKIEKICSGKYIEANQGSTLIRTNSGFGLKYSLFKYQSNQDSMFGEVYEQDGNVVYASLVF